MHLSRKEKDLKEKFINFLNIADEDKITEDLLVPLFMNLGFERVNITGHKDKHLEFGKDLWMAYKLPTEHKLLIGVQVKRGRIHASGTDLDKNIGGILSQLLMMLFYPVSDMGSKHLIDHIYLVSSGEITKQARNLLEEVLDNGMRRNILFLDRNELIELCMKYPPLAHKLQIETKELSTGGFKLNTASRILSYKGINVELTPNEVLVMELFLRRPNTVFTHSEIISQLGYELKPGKNLAEITRPIISRLKKETLNFIPEVSECIKNIRGAGYTFDIENLRKEIRQSNNE